MYTACLKAGKCHYVSAQKHPCGWELAGKTTRFLENRSSASNERPQLPAPPSIGCQPLNTQCFTSTVFMIMYCYFSLVLLCLHLSLSVKFYLTSVHQLCATYLTKVHSNPGVYWKACKTPSDTSAPQLKTSHSATCDWCFLGLATGNFSDLCLSLLPHIALVSLLI